MSIGLKSDFQSACSRHEGLPLSYGTIARLYTISRTILKSGCILYFLLSEKRCRAPCITVFVRVGRCVIRLKELFFPFNLTGRELNSVNAESLLEKLVGCIGEGTMMRRGECEAGAIIITGGGSTNR